MSLFITRHLFALAALLGLVGNRLAAQSLSGLVLDSVNRQPVAFATVALWQRDSVLLSGTTTDETGHFALSSPSSDHAVLRIQSVGYLPTRVPVGRTGSGSARVLPVIYLRTNEVALAEVAVRGQRAINAVLLDKQVFTTKQFQNAAGGTGLDVLKRLPAFTVTSEGSIALRGNENVQVLLNGKPTTRTAAEVLAQLAANQIEQIEVSTSPSARYDSDGKAGIVNISPGRMLRQDGA